jgi:hypothetical protein
MTTEGDTSMNDNPPSGASQWKQIPGDNAVVSRTSQIFNPFVASDPVPRSIRPQVFQALLRPGEEMIALMHSPRVILDEPGVPTSWIREAAGVGSTRSLIAMTRSRLFFFTEFPIMPPGEGGLVVAPLGLKANRQYREFPIGDGASLSPLAKARFTITWASGLKLTVCAKQIAAPPIYRRKPIKKFYRALKQVLGQSPIG